MQHLLERIPEKKLTADSDLDIEEITDGLGINFKISANDLSKGEQQLICICRAVLRHNSIVFLDEATANIDIVTEEKVQNLMNKSFKNSTVFTIAHRINTIINSDKVLVLDKGTNIEYGNPKELASDPTSEFSVLIKEIEQKKKE